VTRKIIVPISEAVVGYEKTAKLISAFYSTVFKSRM
jgi:hypothetical protein